MFTYDFMINAFAASGSPVYLYRFSYVLSTMRERMRAGASHASEIPFVFGTLTPGQGSTLTPEDQAIQSMPDVSPTKWHLAHTSWFFETFILGPLDPGYRVFDPAFAYLFNSYYEAVGPRHPRPQRGLLSRPTIDVIAAYRDHVTAAMLRLIGRASEAEWTAVATLLVLEGHSVELPGSEASPQLHSINHPLREQAAVTHSTLSR